MHLQMGSLTCITPASVHTFVSHIFVILFTFVFYITAGNLHTMPTTVSILLMKKAGQEGGMG